MAEFIRIVKWKDFQHYSKRNPPWIKLHREMMISETWVSLNDAGRVLAIACMMLASASDNKTRACKRYIRRAAYLHSEPDFNPLVDIGFIEIIDEKGNLASNPLALASNLQADARPETETEEESIHKVQPCTKTARTADARFRKIFDYGTEIFPALASRRTAIISQWLAAGADVNQDILPEIARAQGREVRSWEFFTGAVMDAKASRERPLPNGTAKPQKRHAYDEQLEIASRIAKQHEDKFQ